MVGQFCTNTLQPARPFLSPTQQSKLMAWMFQGQYIDFARSTESLHTQVPYQPVDSPPNHIEKSE